MQSLYQDTLVPERRDPAAQLRAAGPSAAAAHTAETWTRALGAAVGAAAAATAAPLQPHYRPARRAVRPAAGVQLQHMVPLRAVCRAQAQAAQRLPLLLARPSRRACQADAVSPLVRNIPPPPDLYSITTLPP